MAEIRADSISASPESAIPSGTIRMTAPQPSDAATPDACHGTPRSMARAPVRQVLPGAVEKVSGSRSHSTQRFASAAPNASGDHGSAGQSRMALPRYRLMWVSSVHRKAPADTGTASVRTRGSPTNSSGRP
jgi:hypothetical protein